MHRLARHPNIVQLHAITMKGNNPVLIVELGTDTLENYLCRGPPVGWIEKLRYCIDLVEGVNALHSKGVVHGDLKASNILLFPNRGKSVGSMTAKVNDFGFSYAMSSAGNHGGGTLNFLAPECITLVVASYPELEQWGRRPPQDVYGVGLIIWQVAMNGALPNHELSTKYKIESAKLDKDLGILLEKLPESTPKDVRDVIVQATRFLPSERASLAGIGASLKLSLR